ncbi:unnamed protein product [Trichogramma brassicae]|uniref:Ubiquitin-like protease family profile domain-containing protein n=1 Tax=Trichogramma brassicae TaxID=86971 RepID=A0A6H5ISS6_9HYME|nr:unnamed protein product [Trichogramma brassicae]
MFSLKHIQSLYGISAQAHKHVSVLFHVVIVKSLIFTHITICKFQLVLRSEIKKLVTIPAHARIQFVTRMTRVKIKSAPECDSVRKKRGSRLSRVQGRIGAAAAAHRVVAQPEVRARSPVMLCCSTRRYSTIRGQIMQAAMPTLRAARRAQQIIIYRRRRDDKSRLHYYTYTSAIHNTSRAMARETSRAICVDMTTLPRIFGRHSVYLFYIDFVDRATATMSYARVYYTRRELKHTLFGTVDAYFYDSRRCNFNRVGTNIHENGAKSTSKSSRVDRHRLIRRRRRAANNFAEFVRIDDTDVVALRPRLASDIVDSQPSNGVVRPRPRYHNSRLPGGGVRALQVPADPCCKTRVPHQPESVALQIGGHIESIITYPEGAQSGGFTIRVSDYKCLDDGAYLNDVMIDFCLKYFFDKILLDENRKRTFVFSSFFYQNIVPGPNQNSKDCHEKVKRWTKSINIFTKDFIIIPINLKPCILIFDSMQQDRGDVFTPILNYLTHEYEAQLHETFQFSMNNMGVDTVVVPAQRNSWNCGLFALEYVERFYTKNYWHGDVRSPRVNRFLIQSRTYGISVAARTAIMQKVANEYIEVAAAGHTSHPHHPQ